MFGQRLAIDAGGFARLASTGMQGPTTAEQAAFAQTLATAINDPNRVLISLSSGSPSTLVGNFQNQDIDVRDVGAFGRGPGPTAAGVFAHEIAEQHGKQVQGLGFTAAHAAGNAAQGAASGWTRGEQRSFLDGSLSGTVATTHTRGQQRMDVSIKVDKGNIERIDRVQR